MSVHHIPQNPNFPMFINCNEEILFIAKCKGLMCTANLVCEICRIFPKSIVQLYWRHYNCNFIVISEFTTFIIL